MANDDLKGQDSSNLYNPGFGPAPERRSKVLMDSDDISPDAKQTLGDYLKEITVDNRRPVPNGGSTELSADTQINSEEYEGTFSSDLKKDC